MKPIKPKKSRLVLRHEQIRKLEPSELERMRGGLPPLSLHGICDTWTALCTYVGECN